MATPASFAAYPEDYVVYDLETSDLFPAGEILEIGALKVIGGEVVGEFSELCRLEPGETAAPRALEVNGLTLADLEGRRSRAEVFGDFVAFCDGLPLLGFNNKGFDDLFVAREAERAGVPNPAKENGSYDVRRAWGWGSLSRHCADYGVANDNAHRAVSDAMATHRLLVSARAAAGLLSAARSRL